MTGNGGKWKERIKLIIMHTQEQIEAKAREIGGRPYHPTDDYYHFGITIRQELMRTAMGLVCPGQPDGLYEYMAKEASKYTNALLIQMAKDELGVDND
jgi:hypothetical protein